tara:strand:+ start:2019 stop:4355 length:2337 start_codon:yes stop_codon:yes gene_type:complete
MNQSTKFNNNHLESFDNFDLKKEFKKYLYYWKYFAFSTLLCFLISLIFLKYTQKVYYVEAKIKVLDKKETLLDLPTASELFSNSKINLENEIEILNSFPILSQVIRNKNLHTSVFEIGDIMESLSINYPFEIVYKHPVDSISKSVYEFNITDIGFEIYDAENSLNYNFTGISSINVKHDLPFEILNFQRNRFLNDNIEGYEIRLLPIDEAVFLLKESLIVSQVGKESDILEIGFKSMNPEYAKTVINELINVFNDDGIEDRRQIHKRTIDFVNERYIYLALELDTIENKKQLFKANNNLVDLYANSTLSLEQSYKSQENIFSLENQISLTSLLKASLNNNEFELLPANIGIENVEINSLILEFNSLIIERKKILQSAGQNNPSIRQLDIIIQDILYNINVSLKNYLNQLESTKQKFSLQSKKFDNQVLNIPEKEKTLRAIERNQQIKEALYLFLLQKREEAEVSYAVTEPSIKVVEYAFSNNIPVSPRPAIIIIGSVLLGLLIPFIFLYIKFTFNTKIYSKEDLKELEIDAPILGEIPSIVGETLILKSSNQRDILSESFRVLSSNLNFLIPKSANKEGTIIFTTSTIKGEGKTFCSVNLSLTYSSLNKKVLLIGADLYNPQIHRYINSDKSVDGLSNFLVDDGFDWKKSLIKVNSTLDCDIMLAGSIPPNPTQLITNGNFAKLLADAKKSYDFVVVDTPPSLVVSDTLSIAHLSDIILFVTRHGYTEKETLNFIKDTINSGKIKNTGLIINDISKSNSHGYGYNYGYSYGYGSDFKK